MSSLERMNRVLAGEAPDRRPFVPSVYEHGAAVLGKSPGEVSRDPDLMARAAIAARALYDHDIVTVGIFHAGVRFRHAVVAGIDDTVAVLIGFGGGITGTGRIQRNNVQVIYLRIAGAVHCVDHFNGDRMSPHIGKHRHPFELDLTAFFDNVHVFG